MGFWVGVRVIVGLLEGKVQVGSVVIRETILGLSR